MKKKLSIAILAISLNVCAQSPISITQKVADYIIANTPFQYKLDLFKPSHNLSDLQSIDFEKNFNTKKFTVAMAVTHLLALKDTTIELEISYSSALQVSLNNQIKYTSTANNELNFQFLERSIQLNKKIQLQLRKGINQLYFKSVYTKSKDWKILFQCSNANKIKIGLDNIPQLNKEVCNISNFLICGGFTVKGVEDALTQKFEAEQTVDGAKLFSYNGKQYTWSIPKIELTQNVINPQPYWGSFYNYNYHTAGVAWAVAELGNVTGIYKYKKFTTDYCNFILKSKPFVTYQVRNLWQTNCTDYLMVNTPLLDFTSAPAMPFLYTLINEASFKERAAYNAFFQQIKNYIFNQQIRLPQGNFTRETPEKFTTWVDDMFMGLPFVIHCAAETKDANEKKKYQDDAAKQVLAFANILLDTKDSLFHHAKHSNRPDVQYPYWLRANGWGIWAITEVLKGLPKNHESYNKIMHIYQSLVAALAKQQDASGMWHNIINIPTARLETSGSSIITLAIARGVNRGWLDTKMYSPIAQKGWEAICKRIEPDGQVNDIIVGSFTSEDYHYYENQPFVKNDSHGMLCVLMCGLEMEKLAQQQKTVKK
jgi:unsaturated rhamnogalacturonyl hydrolase